MLANPVWIYKPDGDEYICRIQALTHHKMRGCEGCVGDGLDRFDFLNTLGGNPITSVDFDIIRVYNEYGDTYRAATSWPSCGNFLVNSLA